MAKSARTVLAVLVRLLLLAVLVLLLVHFVDLGETVATVRRLSVATFAGCIGLELLFYGVESWRLRYLAARRYRYADIWRSRLLTSFLTSFLPGTAVGEVARVFVLDRARPGNKLYLALLFLTNRLSGAVTLACMMLLGLCAYNQGSWPIAIAGCVALLVAPLVVRVRWVRGTTVTWIRRRRGRARMILATTYRAMSSFGRPRIWAFAIATSLITNFIVVAEFWWLGRDLDVHLGLGLWIVTVSVSTFASVIPIGFGAIGTQDASLVLIARAVGRPLDPMLAVSVAVHIVRITATLPGILYLGDWLRGRRETASKNAPEL